MSFKLVWNRLRYLKAPQTGKRMSRLNPQSEWIITEVPELRIMDDDLWQAVRARQALTAEKSVHISAGIRMASAARNPCCRVWYSAACVRPLLDPGVTASPAPPT